MKKAILDPIDIRILSAVQQNGQLSKSRLAELVNLSQTPCWARLSKLKSAGLIRGYRADIALERITNLSRVFVTVSLSSHRKSTFDLFEKRINERDEIVECFATGGGMDYIMKLVTPNLGTFLATMESLLSEELGIERYMTYIVTREVKSTPPNLALLGRINLTDTPAPQVGPNSQKDIKI
jgi:Lrp/AsnC family transcriptional regulator of ectoine degradation